jgi:hypothetical protein
VRDELLLMGREMLRVREMIYAGADHTDDANE